MLKQDARIRPGCSGAIDGNRDLVGAALVGGLLDHDLMVTRHW
jgi:hypothetical protein